MFVYIADRKLPVCPTLCIEDILEDLGQDRC